MPSGGRLRPSGRPKPGDARQRTSGSLHLPAAAPVVGGVPGVERRLARRLLRAIGSPPVGLVLWNGEEIAESNVGTAVAGDRTVRRRSNSLPRSSGVLESPARSELPVRRGLRRGPARSRRRPGLAAGDDLSLACGGKPVGQRRLLGPARLAASRQEQHARRRPAEHPPSLRHRRRLLPAVARSGDGL